VFLFKAKIGVFVPFSAAYASQSRTESSPGALRSFCFLRLYRRSTTTTTTRS
jgi:hypothetical protein